MRVLLIGHSYVRQLKQTEYWPSEIINDNGIRIGVDFRFIFKAGKDYEYFNTTGYDVLDTVRDEIDPDIVVVILGGNSITNNKNNGDIKKEAESFFQNLRMVTRPECITIAVQIEPRYYEPGNHFNCPEPEEFNRRRQVINNFVKGPLKKKGLVQYVMQLGSMNRFGPERYKDGVHLNEEGLETYKELLISVVKYATEH